jgi:hypothetical protein
VLYPPAGIQLVNVAWLPMHEAKTEFPLKERRPVRGT